MENLPSSKHEEVADLHNTPKFEEFEYFQSEDAKFWQDSHQVLSLLPPEVNSFMSGI